MIKNSKIGKLFGGLGKKKSDNDAERAKRDDDIHVEISQLSDNE